MDRLPSYPDLAAHYSTALHQCPDTATSEHPCAIRLSRAMMAYGIALTPYSGKKCRHGFARGAQDLGAFILSKYGTYNLGFSKPMQVPSSLLRKRGIILFANIPGYDGQGHIDMWDGFAGTCISGTTGYWDANPIWFWQMAEAPSPAFTESHGDRKFAAMDSTGKCGAHHYPNFTKDKVELLLTKLREHFTVQGGNPWTVDVGQGGVVLEGSWDSKESILTIIVKEKWLVTPCSRIWDEIDPIIGSISGTII